MVTITLWRRYIPLKCWWPPTRSHSIATQKTIINNFNKDSVQFHHISVTQSRVICMQVDTFKVTRHSYIIVKPVWNGEKMYLHFLHLCISEKYHALRWIKAYIIIVVLMICLQPYAEQGSPSNWWIWERKARERWGQSPYEHHHAAS